MPPQPAPTPAKRRGRPPSNTSEVDDATLKARRQRNREAQNVFRRRRQVAEAEQTKRLRRLEEVVEEMSSIFIGFVDEMLETEVVNKQPDLVGSLRRSVSRILALANEVVGPDDSGDVSCAPAAAPVGLSAPISSSASTLASGSVPASSSAPVSTSGTTSTPAPTSTSALVATTKLRGIPEYDTPGHSSTSPPGDSSTASHTSDDTMDYDPYLINETALQSSLTAVIRTLPGPPGLNSTYDNANFPEEPSDGFMPDDSMPGSMHPQIYGNGWALTGHPIIDSRFWGPRVPLSPDSFAYRLAKASLTIAYLILTKSQHPPVSQTEETRIFGSNLRYRDRGELLIRLRWLLGPGSEDMYRVIDLPYGQHGSQVFSRNDLNPTFEELGWSGIWKPRLHNVSAGYLSILGVEKQLLALGGRVVDSETLELNIASPSSVDDPPSEVLSAQPDSWSFVDFFSPNQLRPRPNVLTMQLSMPLLVSNLARGAVCLLRGPGYPRDELGGAIQASVVKVTQ
ncbi:hypothetical protein AK830_g1918 [Neonectria ditissima]|uniref:BZIP domain-containing protein n=1 Tax=Neonectria ditissima TaxID=78410 RepID=A0A0P7BHB0_9HYPO|nr:hypothetical protein AK830_g1918 [Neonectria ditissima]